MRAFTTNTTRSTTAPRMSARRSIVSGRIVDKYAKRGRPYLWYYLEVRTSEGRLVTTYNDLTVLRYKVEGGQ